MVLVVPVLTGMHVYVLWLCVVLRQWGNAELHAGVEGPWSLLSRLPGARGRPASGLPSFPNRWELCSMVPPLGQALRYGDSPLTGKPSVTSITESLRVDTLSRRSPAGRGNWPVSQQSDCISRCCMACVSAPMLLDARIVDAIRQIGDTTNH